MPMVRGGTGAVAERVVEGTPLTRRIVAPALLVVRLRTVVLGPVPSVIGGPPGARVWLPMRRSVAVVGVRVWPAIVRVGCAGVAWGWMVEESVPTNTMVAPAELVARLTTVVEEPWPRVMAGAPGASVWLEMTKTDAEFWVMV